MPKSEKTDFISIIRKRGKRGKMLQLGLFGRKSLFTSERVCVAGELLLKNVRRWRLRAVRSLWCNLHRRYVAWAVVFKRFCLTYFLPSSLSKKRWGFSSTCGSVRPFAFWDDLCRSFSVDNPVWVWWWCIHSCHKQSGNEAVEAFSLQGLIYNAGESAILGACLLRFSRFWW